jgi:hypothetical protein
MRIAFLGWDSLIYCPRDFKISGSWEEDGSFLPVEFARVSKDCRLTLVLFPNVSDVQVLWVLATHENLQQAKVNLKKREGTILEDIGFVSIPENRYHCRALPHVLPRIKEWVEKKEFDAVVWTDLKSNFKAKTRMDFYEDNVIAYLRGLKGDAHRKARTYIQKAPKQIRT